MKRTIEPEWLDALPPNDPLAIGSRRDLQRINRIMGHVQTLCGVLQTMMPNSTPQRIVELGAGDGTLMLELARRLSPKWKKVNVILLDCKDAVSNETRRDIEACGWKIEIIAADVFDFLKKPTDRAADVMFANLFLHHFPDDLLKSLFHLASKRTKLFAACEPRRALMPLIFSKLVGVIGCNAVTRRDATLSVHAGFQGKELSALWPHDECWRLREQRAQFFTHAFVVESNP